MIANDHYQMVFEKLMDLVNQGILKPNEKIYSENRMARLLGIPRAQVREVYSALRILGILYGQQGRGTYFKPTEQQNGSDLLYLMTRMEKSSFEDIVAMRRILETGSAELAAKNRLDTQVLAMKACIEVMEDSSDPQVLAKQDADLHFYIVQASGNDLLRSLLQIVFGYISRIVKDHWKRIIEGRQSEAQELFLLQHKRIVAAIELRRPDSAKAAMEKHMDSLIENMLRSRDDLALNKSPKNNFPG
jgi:GntR family transcriptional repressor for pyruvate dehydrogenase complex